MKTITRQQITEAVARLCIQANTSLPADVAAALARARKEEPWPLAAQTLGFLEENLEIARQKDLPICQDTGSACLFCQVGSEVKIEGDLTEALNEGVRQGYTRGYLRKSIVSDPLRRVNTEDNTPAFIHTELTAGDKLTITLMPKGGGAENMSRLAMLKPADGVEGVKKFVVDCVKQAGSNPCPPIILGVGIGGTFDQVALLAKKALLRPLDTPHPDPFYAALEKELLDLVNATGVGPQGFGGRTTALGLAIETLPTHVASLPVAVNINCHVTRRASVEL